MGRVAIGIVSGLVLSACLGLGVSAASAGNPGPFGWLVPASAPSGATDVARPESVAETILEAVETQAAEVYTENLKQALSESTLRA